MPVHRLSLPVRPPFALPLVLRSHGWVSLPPHRYAGGAAPWQVPLRLGADVVAATVTQQGPRLQVALQGRRKLPAAALAAARAQLRHMLRLDDDLAAFWERCAGHAELGWVPRRGAGRLLRSACVFEDLMKLLFTTNCTWAATTSMTKNLVQALGAEAPDGSRAFPTAADCARGEPFWRDVVRVGYRARACQQLAQRFADGDLDDAHFAEPSLPTGEIRARVLALHGFGPYAAGQAMRLFGRYDDLALDSWCRTTIGKLLRRRKPPSDAAIGRRYRAFGEWAGLALWCELTAPWHGEGPAARELAGDAQALWS